MTTIAWDGKSLAGDSRITRNDVVMPEAMVKVVRSKDGHLGAVAGRISMQCEDFLEWVKDGCQGEPIVPKQETIFIYICPKGVLKEITRSDSVCKVRHRGYYAWGSGSNFALGAMAMGASAKRSIEVAGQFDPYTGGKIISYTLEKFQ